jgi:hypothetical protein
MRREKLEPSTKRMREKARGILHRVGLRGPALSDDDVTRLINAAKGRAWGGDHRDWPRHLEGFASYFVHICLESGIRPIAHDLVLTRKQVARSWAHTWLVDTLIGRPVAYEETDEEAPTEEALLD